MHSTFWRCFSNCLDKIEACYDAQKHTLDGNATVCLASPICPDIDPNGAWFRAVGDIYQIAGGKTARLRDYAYRDIPIQLPVVAEFIQDADHRQDRIIFQAPADEETGFSTWKETMLDIAAEWIEDARHGWEIQTDGKKRWYQHDLDDEVSVNSLRALITVANAQSASFYNAREPRFVSAVDETGKPCLITVREDVIDNFLSPFGISSQSLTRQNGLYDLTSVPECRSRGPDL